MDISFTVQWANFKLAEISDDEWKHSWVCKVSDCQRCRDIVKKQQTPTQAIDEDSTVSKSFPTEALALKFAEKKWQGRSKDSWLAYVKVFKHTHEEIKRF